MVNYIKKYRNAWSRPKGTSVYKPKRYGSDTKYEKKEDALMVLDDQIKEFNEAMVKSGNMDYDFKTYQKNIKSGSSKFRWLSPLSLLKKVFGGNNSANVDTTDPKLNPETPVTDINYGTVNHPRYEPSEKKVTPTKKKDKEDVTSGLQDLIDDNKKFRV